MFPWALPYWIFSAPSNERAALTMHRHLRLAPRAFLFVFTQTLVEVMASNVSKIFEFVQLLGRLKVRVKD